MASVAVVSLYVADLNAATAFYSSLGFTVVARPTADIVVLGGESPTVVLCQGGAAGAGYPPPRGVVAGIPVKDAAAAAAVARAAGGRPLFAAPEAFPEGVFVAVEDPSGNLVELLEFR